MKLKINLKYFFIFYVFLLLFLFQMGISYLLYYDNRISIVIDSLFASSLIMCFSFGFILIDLGFKNEINSDKNIIIRYSGIILVMISFGCVMMVMI